MTLSTTTVVQRYAGNGVTRAFAYSYQLTSAADLNVRVVSSAGVVTTPTVTITLPATTPPNTPPYSGATVTFAEGDGPAPASGSTVVIWRGPALTQEFNFKADGDPLLSLNTAMDRVYGALQDERAFGLRVAPATAVAIDPTVPAPTSTDGGKVLALNAARTALVWQTGGIQGEQGPPGDSSALGSDLASHANGKGAALVGIEDAAGKITATTVEGALAEHAALLAALDQAVILKGTWNASGGSFPGSGAAQSGWSYIVSTGGTVNGIDFAVGDRAIAITDNASTSTYSGNWFKADGSDLVTSVAGKTGTVTLALADLTNTTTTLTNLIASTGISGTVTVSTSSPSGGADGDIWLKREA